MDVAELICANFDKCPNPYVSDLRWVVILSDDSCVWQDDNDPKYEEKSAWLRLRDYLRDSDLFIKRILLEFRGHMEIIDITDDVKGVFFRKAIGGDVMSESTQDFYIFGKLIENDGIEELSVDWFMVPELILHRNEKRTNIADHEEHLIRRAAR